MACCHVEREKLTGRRLGRRPHDPARPALKLGDMLSGTIPRHPLASDHLSRVTDWTMLGNDRFGDCGPVAVANSRRVVTKYLTGTEFQPSLDQVYDLYRRSGNPGFDPATGVDDNGVDMATMLAAVASGGFGGVRCVAYAQVDVTNIDEIRAAISIFGCVLLGVDLDTAQQRQTDKGLWDYQPSPEWGGHATLAGRYSSATTGADIGVETWAQVIEVTDTFIRHQAQEVWVVIWPEHLGSVQFQQGIDSASANAAYTALTGRPGPFPQTPAPAPAPLPADVAAFYQSLRATATSIDNFLRPRGF